LIVKGTRDATNCHLRKFLDQQLPSKRFSVYASPSFLSWKRKVGTLKEGLLSATQPTGRRLRAVSNLGENLSLLKIILTNKLETSLIQLH
ncbi:MAG TPA: hypothetical protein DCF63_19370, partial [Planctomycetaceae bacterium]|nr:hypothetical protein [Planctomycetaceae bacterium]